MIPVVIALCVPEGFGVTRLVNTDALTGPRLVQGPLV
jgi:hypothetical protein